MEPSATPPWRVLETPPSDAADRGRIEPQTRATGAATSLAKVGVIVAIAIACAVLAIVLAVTGGGGSVRVEGGSPLAVDASGAVTGSPDTRGGCGTRRGDRRSGAEPWRVSASAGFQGRRPRPHGRWLWAAGRHTTALNTSSTWPHPSRTANRSAFLPATTRRRWRRRVPARPAMRAVAGSSTSTRRRRPSSRSCRASARPPRRRSSRRVRRPHSSAVDELRSRGVLGEKTFEKLRALVTVG